MEQKQAPPRLNVAVADVHATWHAYWTAQGQPWRLEPEIAAERQRFLAERRAVAPDVQQGTYPFKDIALSRADVEWLLATHEHKGKQGPVDATDLQSLIYWDSPLPNLRDVRIGLDLRGADLSGVDLSGLPLGRTLAALESTETNPVDREATREARDKARVRLTRANLRGAHLEQALLAGAAMDEADFEGAYLGHARLDDALLPQANLKEADLTLARLFGAKLAGANLAGADLSFANLGSAEAAGASLVRAVLCEASLVGARLREADLEHADLSNASLIGAVLDGAHLDDAILDGAKIPGVSFDGASLARASLKGIARVDLQTEREASFRGAHLAGANLSAAGLPGAHFDGADLTSATLAGAQLERASLKDATLAGADLSAAHLEGANLTAARLERADLRRAVFDAATLLEDASFGVAPKERPLVAGLRWGGADLTGLDWEDITALGDEQVARARRDPRGKVKPRSVRLAEWDAAMRANQQLATALQDQGLSDEATPFAYRARVLQHRLLWRQLVWRGQVRSLGPYLFSTLLARLTGHGYRMWRLLVAYLLVVSASAVAFHVLAPRDSLYLAWPDAFLVSVTAIHGRVFSEQFQPGSLLGWITVVESIAGLVIEGTFVAMLTQRFFGK